jgi:Insertion element 4 transposase N-terminal
MTVICVLVACLFPGTAYDTVLATAFGLPGLRFKPGAGVPAGSAFSQARRLLGEQAMKRAFKPDAARSDAELGNAALWKGLEVTALAGTTMERPQSSLRMSLLAQKTRRFNAGRLTGAAAAGRSAGRPARRRETRRWRRDRRWRSWPPRLRMAAR